MIKPQARVVNDIDDESSIDDSELDIMEIRDVKSKYAGQVKLPGKGLGRNHVDPRLEESACELVSYSE